MDKLQKRDVTKVCADKLQKRDGRKIRVDKLHNCDVLVTVTSQIRAYTSCRSVIVKIGFFLPSRYYRHYFSTWASETHRQRRSTEVKSITAAKEMLR